VVARAHAVGLFFVLGSLFGCAHAAVDLSTDDTSSIVPDAGHDSAVVQHPQKDASAADTSQSVEDSSVEVPDSSPVCSPKFTTGIPQCDTCEGQNCCLEDNACANNSQCTNIVTCYDNCIPNDGGPPDPNCMSNCDSTYPQGATLLNAWGQCIQTNCANDCR
jgi:hypothetical protein